MLHCSREHSETTLILSVCTVSTMKRHASLTTHHIGEHDDSECLDVLYRVHNKLRVLGTIIPCRFRRIISTDICSQWKWREPHWQHFRYCNAQVFDYPTYPSISRRNKLFSRTKTTDCHGSGITPNIQTWWQVRTYRKGLRDFAVLLLFDEIFELR